MEEYDKDHLKPKEEETHSHPLNEHSLDEDEQYEDIHYNSFESYKLLRQEKELSFMEQIDFVLNEVKRNSQIDLASRSKHNPRFENYSIPRSLLALKLKDDPKILTILVSKNGFKVKKKKLSI